MLECCSSNLASQLNEARNSEVYMLEKDNGCRMAFLEQTNILVVDVCLALVVRPWVFFPGIYYWRPDGNDICP